MSSDSGRGPTSRPPETKSERSGGILMGRPFGIPVYVAPSWFIVAALITVWFAPLAERQLPDIGNGSYVVALAFAVLLYLSVLVHELSHSLVALRLGLPVRRISLHLLGGVSEIEREPETPKREFLVAAAGPALSLLLGGFGYVLVQLLSPGTILQFLFVQLTVANLLVGAFNLLPGLPLDGGRILQSGIWQITGRRYTSVIAAAWVGRVLAFAILLAPMLLASLTGGRATIWSVIWAALIASFMWLGANQAMQVARVREKLPALSARSLSRRAIPVGSAVPLAEAVRQADEAGARGLVVVDSAGKPVGLVSEAAVSATPPARRPWVQTGSVSRSIAPDLVVQADLTGQALVNAMRSAPASEYLVVEPSGEIFGVLASSDVERALARS